MSHPEQPANTKRVRRAAGSHLLDALGIALRRARRQRPRDSSRLTALHRAWDVFTHSQTCECRGHKFGSQVLTARRNVDLICHQLSV